jgi:MFS superfamily sulfate permease-like transporter
MASLMGLPPVLGIFTSILTSIFTSILTAPIIALLGRNPVLIGGTASATVPFIALAVRQHGVAGAARISVLASLISGCCIWACPRSPPAGGDPKELLAAFPSAFALALISSVNILITSRVVEGCTT